MRWYSCSRVHGSIHRDSGALYLKYLNLGDNYNKGAWLLRLGSTSDVRYTGALSSLQPWGATSPIAEEHGVASPPEGALCASPQWRLPRDWHVVPDSGTSADCEVRAAHSRSLTRRPCFLVWSENRNSPSCGGGLYHGHWRPTRYCPQVRERDTGPDAAGWLLRPPAVWVVGYVLRCSLLLLCVFTGFGASIWMCLPKPRYRIMWLLYFLVFYINTCHV